MAYDPHTIDRHAEIPVDPTEAAAVEAVVRDYIDAWHAGDARRMEGSLHDALVKQRITETPGATGGLSRVTKTEMVQFTGDGGDGSPGAAADVVVHHVEGGIASAQVATAEYLDYLHLAKTGGAWRIVHDLFRQKG